MVFLKLSLVFGSIFYFLFQIFRKLKADYDPLAIVNFSLLFIILSSSFYYMDSYLDLGFIFLPFLFALFLSTFIFARFFSWEFWVVSENLVVPLLIAVGINYYFDWLVGLSFLITLVLNFYWSKYRNFKWYPSGKIGFLFLANVFVFSLIQGGLDFYFQELLKSLVWLIVLLITVIKFVHLADEIK